MSVLVQSRLTSQPAGCPDVTVSTGLRFIWPKKFCLDDINSKHSSRFIYLVVKDAVSSFDIQGLKLISFLGMV